MTASRLPDGTLVLRESWTGLRFVTLLGAVLLLALVVPPCVPNAVCDRHELLGGCIAAGLFTLVGALVQDATFAFHPTAAVMRWRRRRLLTSTSGELPFADIIGVTSRATLERGDDGRSPRTEYRLALVTTGGDVFLSSTHSLDRNDYTAIADMVQAVLHH
jgi:hypothetical protein